MSVPCLLELPQQSATHPFENRIEGEGRLQKQVSLLSLHAQFEHFNVYTHDVLESIRTYAGANTKYMNFLKIYGYKYNNHYLICIFL